MAKKPVNAGTQWMPKDESTLRDLAKRNTPTGLIAYKLGRTKGAVQDKAGELNISLKPTNKPPYNKQKH